MNNILTLTQLGLRYQMLTKNAVDLVVLLDLRKASRECWWTNFAR